MEFESLQSDGNTFLKLLQQNESKIILQRPAEFTGKNIVSVHFSTRWQAAAAISSTIS